MYGALHGLNKSETATKFGEGQVKVHSTCTHFSHSLIVYTLKCPGFTILNLLLLMCRSGVARTTRRRRRSRTASRTPCTRETTRDTKYSTSACLLALSFFDRDPVVCIYVSHLLIIATVVKTLGTFSGSGSCLALPSQRDLPVVAISA